VNSTTVVILVAAVELAGVITLTTLLVVSRRHLSAARRELDRRRDGAPRRRRRRGVAPMAIRTVWHTADSLINKGIGATVRNSVEDLAGWARVERPDLARITADGEVVIVFSDIEGSTTLNRTLGDRDWVKLLERHNKLIGQLVGAHGGHVVKSQGDGFMIAFADPVEAVRCCIALQRTLTEDPAWTSVRVRTGIHMGSSVRRGDDLFGLNVAMAARVAGEAVGGEILVSEAVRAAVEGSPAIAFSAPQLAQLKGLEGDHPLYAVEAAT
jgi:adenylate cyclase